MPLAQTHYSLKNVVVTLKTGVIVNLISLNIKRNPKYDQKWPGQALVPSQVYMGEDLPTLDCEVYNDDTMNFAEVIPNAAIDTLTVLSPNDADASFLQSDFFTKFPPSSMVFGGPDTSLTGDKQSTLKFSIMCNVLNPGADGGYPA